MAAVWYLSLSRRRSFTVQIRAAGLPTSPSTAATEVIAAIFANQADWLARSARESFRPRWGWRDLRTPLPAPRHEAEVEVDLQIASGRDRDTDRRPQTSPPEGSRTAIYWLLDHGADPDIAPLWAMGSVTGQWGRQEIRAG